MGYCWKPRPLASPRHDLDEGLIDHVHLFAVSVGEVHLPCPHDGGQVLQILGTVQSRVMLEKGAWVPQRLGVFTP